LVGIIILTLSLIVSGATYLDVSKFQWTPGDLGFIYSLVLTLGFVAAIAAGLFGALKESEEFLIAGGAACIALSILNKFFANILYSWGYLDVMLMLAGALMIVDRFYVKRVKEAKQVEPTHLLDELDRLEAEAYEVEPRKAVDLEKAIYDVKRKLWTEAEKKPALVKTLRVRLYRSPVAQGIVKRLIDLEVKAIEPTIETGTEPKYPQLENLANYPQKKIQSTLDELVDTGVLLKEPYERLVACPSCHETSKVFIRHNCPKCGSSMSQMDRLMEHVKCGSTYKQREYHGPHGIRCPKCDKTVNEEQDLRSVGVVFECASCKSIFSDPIQAFHCRRCESEFMLKNCELKDTYSYLLNDKVRSEAMKTLTVLTMADMVEKQGWKVKIPGVVKGKSGVEHEFTLTCQNKRTIAIDLATSETKVDMETALSSYAKFIDILNVEKLIIAMPRLERTAKDFLKANKITYIEGKKIAQINDQVKPLLE
jgi:hypothetical protein